ncbi:hypothetical protein TNCV_4597571 [Trichonephila clavipes]|nr:hypothetical protein TNCV_4597571 [Trichonephila clavipes]
MGVYKCIVRLWHGGTRNNRRTASSLVRLVEVEEKWEALDHFQGVIPLNWDGTESNHTVTCMALKAKANDRPLLIKPFATTTLTTLKTITLICILPI